MLLELPSWNDLAQSALEQVLHKDAINYAELEQMKPLDAKQKLSMAKLIARDAGIHLDLTKDLKTKSLNDDSTIGSIYETINRLGCTCVTTNYDTLLDPKFSDDSDADVSFVSSNSGNAYKDNHASPKNNRFFQKNHILPAHLDTPGKVIHLHGAIEDQNSMIVSTKDYLDHYNNEDIQKFLRYLFVKKTVLFIGYSLQEAEILEHVLRHGMARYSEGEEIRRHYLDGFFSNQERLYRNLHKYYMESFGVNLIGFLRDKHDFNQLHYVLDAWALDIVTKSPPLTSDLNLINKMNDGDKPVDRDLLARIDAKPALRPFFFRQAKGLKWFNALKEENYFNPTANPGPVPGDEKGLVKVPHWHVTDYLVAVAPDLLLEENREYAEEILEFMRETIREAKKDKSSNYRTWWQFTRIIQYIPINLIADGDMKHIDYWLDDQINNDLAAIELGEKWLPKLLKQTEDRSKEIACGLLKLLCKTITEKDPNGLEKFETRFRFGDYYAESIIASVATKIGYTLGENGVRIFANELRCVVENSKKDKFSYVWRPTIEDHEQNEPKYNTEDVLISGLRDSLDAYVKSSHRQAATYINSLLEDSYDYSTRISIFAVDQNFEVLECLIDKVIVKRHFIKNLRHEMWNLLHNRYPSFASEIKTKVQNIIGDITAKDENDNIDIKATAYKQAIWLKAIENHDTKMHNLYKEKANEAGAEPSHPAFPGYREGGIVTYKSPVSLDAVLSMKQNELIDTLQKCIDKYNDPWDFVKGPSLEGMVDMLKNATKKTPTNFIKMLPAMVGIDSAYIHALIEAFSDLQKDNKELPWDSMWEDILDFCMAVINRDEFWSKKNSDRRGHFVANRHGVVKSIGKLIENGTKADGPIIPPMLIGKAKEVLLVLINKQSGEEFPPDQDVVHVTINSSKGRCLEAFINLALLEFRSAGEDEVKREKIWSNYEPIFEKELKKSDNGEYEFLTLTVYYLPNFMYMSKEWTMKNLSYIFDDSNYQKWLCAMKAYAHHHRVYAYLYQFLAENNHYAKALDDEYLKGGVIKKIVQSIVVAYFMDTDSIENKDGLIHRLLERNEKSELAEMIRFIYSSYGNIDAKTRKKIMLLWSCVMDNIDVKSKKGHAVASKLVTWLRFIDNVNDDNRKLIHETIKLSEQRPISAEFVKSVARISNEQAMEAAEIWLISLKKQVHYPYPEKDIRAILRNLVAYGEDGKRKAEEIASEYIKGERNEPCLWLEEIIGETL